MVCVHGTIVQVVLQRHRARAGTLLSKTCSWLSANSGSRGCPISPHPLSTLGPPLRSSLSPGKAYATGYPALPTSLPGTFSPLHPSCLDTLPSPPTATLSLLPQCSHPEQVPETRRGAPCRPSSPHGAGHYIPQPPTGHCHQVRLPRGSNGH